jgi:hypothetical protein
LSAHTIPVPLPLQDDLMVHLDCPLNPGLVSFLLQQFPQSSCLLPFGISLR